MKKEGFIYIWRDRKHKRFYVGCHWGTIDDGYICSSKWMRDAYRYRPQDFKRRILKRGIEKTNLLSEEHRYFEMIKDEELGKKYYNLSKKHFGHWATTESSSLTVKQKLSEASKKLHQDTEYRQKYIEGRKKLPPQTKEQKEKRAKALTGRTRTQETKDKISAAQKGKIVGPLSEETKAKISNSLMGSKNPFYGKQHDPALKAEMNRKTSQTLKGRRPANLDMLIKSFWWTDGKKLKRAIDCPGPEWIRGRKLYCTKVK